MTGVRPVSARIAAAHRWSLADRLLGAAFIVCLWVLHRLDRLRALMMGRSA